MQGRVDLSTLALTIGALRYSTSSATMTELARLDQGSEMIQCITLDHWVLHSKSKAFVSKVL